MTGRRVHSVELFLYKNRNISGIKAENVFLPFPKLAKALGKPRFETDHSDDIPHATWYWTWAWKAQKRGSCICLRLAFALMMGEAVELGVGLKGSVELVQEEALVQQNLL